MKINEINKIINEYSEVTEIDKEVKELMKTIAQRAYEAGKEDGANMITEMMKKLEEVSF